MRSIVTVLLLAPALLLAVSLQPVTVLPEDGKSSEPGGQTKAGPSREAKFTIGLVDTVGGTTYDWGANGPAVRLLVRSPGRGVHVLFMYSTDMSSTSFPDRNMRYNYYDYSNRAWNWPDPDFMLAGVNTFADRTGYGSLDADTNGVAIVSAHHTTTAPNLAPVVARDADAGAGIFDYAPGEPVLDMYQWPWVGLGMNGTYQLATIDGTTADNLYWSRMLTWQTWDGAVGIPAPQPEPMFPDHNIAVSKVQGSNKVCITWTNQPGGVGQFPGYYRESPDGGDNWDTPVDLGFPPAFTPGSDTIPSYHITSLFPMYDRQDRLHIVCNVEPVILDTNNWTPGEIWHWCAANPDQWNKIRRSFDNGTPQAAIGYNAMILDRPSLGEDEWGNLFVAWEEFDGQNFEPGPPDRLRADIWYSSSTDNGVTWTDGVQITDGGEVTYRFPCVMNPIGDTVAVTYMIDQRAGFFLYAEGPATNNPIVVQKWGNVYAPGVAGPKNTMPGRMDIAVSPNPFTRGTRLQYAVPRQGNVTLAIYDAAGRVVRTLAQGRSEPGRFTATWDGRSESGALLPSGVYLYRYMLDSKQMSGRLTLTR